VILASAVGLLALASAADADAKGRIVDVSTTASGVRVLFSATGLSASQPIDLTSVQLSIDGTRLAADAARVTDQSTSQVTRTAMLVVDTSGSMAAGGLAGAQHAAAAFLSALPADVRVGLVTFSDTARLAVAPTADRAAVGAALGGLRASGETALYDAVALALRAVGTSGSRNILLLTDGADTRSKTRLGALVPMVQSSRVSLDAVGFRTSDTATAPLATLADAGHGQVYAAQAAAAVADAFQQAAREISGQIVVTVPLSDKYANASHTISITARAGDVVLSDSVFVPLGNIHAGGATSDTTDYGPRALHVGSPASKTMLYLGIGGVFAALAVLLGLAFLAVGRREQSTGVRRRLSIYTLTGRPTEERREETTTVLGESAVARNAVELAGRVVAKRDFEVMLTRKLDAAGVPLKPAEWTLMHVGVAVLLGLVFLVVSGGGLLATMLGMAIGAVTPWFYLAIKESRRTTAFLERMPDTLQLMAGSLVAGHSLPQSIDAVVREGAEPIAGEFNRALVETRLGVAIEDALDGVATRMRSQDFAWVVMAIRIQREVGGNLAEVLTTVAATLRERARLRRQVRVLSAEGRLSAWILGLLPAVFFAYMVLVRPEYVRLLWTDPVGIVLIVVMLIMLAVGALWLRKAVNVEV
jgi:tight adherence protein B